MARTITESNLDVSVNPIHKTKIERGTFGKEAQASDNRLTELPTYILAINQANEPSEALKDFNI